MLPVYKWIKKPTIPQTVISLLKELMGRWKTRLEISRRGEKWERQWINILCWFLQGDSYSAVGFCICEIPIAVLFEESKKYLIREAGNRAVSWTNNFFVNNLKVYQQSHRLLKEVNKTIAQESLYIGSC